MTKLEAIDILHKLEFMDHDYKDILGVVYEIEVERDCRKCKHYRFGEQPYNKICHDCKWCYNDLYEEE